MKLTDMTDRELLEIRADKHHPDHSRATSILFDRGFKMQGPLDVQSAGFSTGHPKIAQAWYAFNTSRK